MKKDKKPTVIIETPKSATAIVGYSKKDVPRIAKKTVGKMLKRKK